MPEHEQSRRDVNMPLLAVIWTVAVLMIVAIVFAVQALYLATEQSQTSQYEDVQSLWLAELRVQQQTNLNSARWVDRDNQVVAIPIADAMRIMVETGGRLPTARPTTQPR